MGRKQSNTVEYFPHFAEQGKTLFILKSRFGNDGYAFWFQLLEILCREENQVYDCNREHSWQYLLSRTGVNEITGAEILSLLSKLGNIDPEMWANKIIWCEKLIVNLEDVYKKRGRQVPQKPNLVDNNKETTTEKPISVTEKPMTGAEMPQSKVNKSKVNKSKVNKSKVNKRKYGELNNVLLTEKEYKKLKDLFGEAGAESRIKALSLYIASKGDKYKSHYATILSWENRDEKGGQGGAHRGHIRTRQLPKTYRSPEEIFGISDG